MGRLIDYDLHQIQGVSMIYLYDLATIRPYRNLYRKYNLYRRYKRSTIFGIFEQNVIFTSIYRYVCREIKTYSKSLFRKLMLVGHYKS